MYLFEIFLLISILLVCVREKRWFKNFRSYVLNTWIILKHIDPCEDKISYISHLWNIFRYTWNLKFRNNIGELATKTWLSSSPLDTQLPFILTIILSPFEHFVEKSETIFHKLLLSTTFLVSKLLKVWFCSCS